MHEKFSLVQLSALPREAKLCVDVISAQLRAEFVLSNSVYAGIGD